MVRAPCCDKMGLKKGPWTREEDQILVSYINKHGHGNWRALPKQAGLLRCGKSCRLRWINYLRPDIKRGNFTAEEEETIIKLHDMLGSRWSAIAAKLPGRTDNEIKNVWHTHLKKRLQKTNDQAHQAILNSGSKTRGSINNNKASIKRSVSNSSTLTSQSEATSFITSSSTSSDCGQSVKVDIKREDIDSSSLDESYWLPQIDESFWTEAAMEDDNNSSSTINNIQNNDGIFPVYHQYPFDDGMDFWYDVFRSGDFPELTF
ncbi:hypothetical protein QN277_027110 [Acacia crassicarpa]|uniref:Uncharacterized protein n=1 Tax=Acacia crassicarpa TaxID=499986 RepID=A0AAE1J993_9FABA|nr:hypothetical protein QN277_027110 [Acacia crassicarpa]